MVGAVSGVIGCDLGVIRVMGCNWSCNLGIVIGCNLGVIGCNLGVIGYVIVCKLSEIVCNLDVIGCNWLCNCL